MIGNHYLIRNYDYHPKTYDGRYILYQPTDGGYAVSGPSMKITGRMDGINEKGLVMAYNFMNRKQPGPGFVCHMIGRLILETCATVDEAVSLLKEIPHRHSFTYIVFDPSGKSFMVEATPRDVIVRQGTACTNHFEKLTDENRHTLTDSLDRLSVMERKQQNAPNMNAMEAFQLLNDPEGGVFSHEYHSWSGTIHTSAYFPKEKKAWFALGGNQQPTEIDFASWLEGTNLGFQYMYGEVDTNIPFVYLDEGADWYHRK